MPVIWYCYIYMPVIWYCYIYMPVIWYCYIYMPVIWYCYIWSIALYGAETWTLRAVDQKHQESFEMWCWRTIEISWTDHVRNEQVLLENQGAEEYPT
jgi:hypothetical protein